MSDLSSRSESGESGSAYDTPRSSASGSPFNIPSYPMNTTGPDNSSLGGEEVSSEGLVPFDSSPVDPAANVLMRALFLPVFACPLDDDARAHPLCADIHKTQARDALDMYYRESIRRYQEVEKSAYLGKELTDYAALNQVLLRQLEELQKESGCDAKIVEALNSVTDEASLKNALAGLTMCDEEQKATADRLLTEKLELLRLMKQEENRIEAERLDKKREEMKAAKARENMSNEVKFLNRVYEALVNTKLNDIGDADHDASQADMVTFAKERLGVKMVPGDPLTLPYEAVDEESKTIYVDILEELIRKAGKIRMMVRFRNKDIIDRDGNQISVKDSYTDANGQNIMEWKEEDDEGDYVGYKLDPQEMNEYKMYRTLHCMNKGNGQLKPSNGKKKQEIRFKEKMDLTFERVFFEEDQAEVFDSLRSFVWSANNGKPMGIFAYGGTGSGKTHTLLGIKEDKGILTRLVEAKILDDEKTSSVDVRVVEIHPRKPAQKESQAGTQGQGLSNLKHRVVDLVALSNNPNVQSTAEGPKIKTNNTGTVSFFEMDTLTFVKKDDQGKVVYQQAIDIRTNQKKNDIDGNPVYLTENGKKISVKVTQKQMRENTVDVKHLKPEFGKLYDDDGLVKNPKATGFNAGDVRAQIKSLNYKQGDSTAHVEIKRVLEYRRVESTSGNVDGSSRSHVVVMIDVNTTEGTTNKFFVVDMAGKEHTLNDPVVKTRSTTGSNATKFTKQWEVSEGINQSLDAFTRYLALTKCKTTATVNNKQKLTSLKISGLNTHALAVHDGLRDASCVVGGKQMPHQKDFRIEYQEAGSRKTETKRSDGSYVQYYGTKIFSHIRYDDDPLYFLTNDLWVNEASKIMLFACVYPLVKDGKLVSSWDSHFNEGGESLDEKKFKRDYGILREMDYIQKIKKQTS